MPRCHRYIDLIHFRHTQIHFLNWNFNLNTLAKFWPTAKREREWDSGSSGSNNKQPKSRRNPYICISYTPAPISPLWQSPSFPQPMSHRLSEFSIYAPRESFVILCVLIYGMCVPLQGYQLRGTGTPSLLVLPLRYWGTLPANQLGVTNQHRQWYGDIWWIVRPAEDFNWWRWHISKWVCTQKNTMLIMKRPT